jgi:predicted nuclease of predicted toxin-antitoxin system
LRFYADENVARGAVLQLRAVGYEVLYVIERTRSLGDRAVIQDAFDVQAIILTQDKDYWRLIMHEKQPSVGAVWLRLGDMPRALRPRRIVEAVQAYDTKLLHRFTVIYPDRVEHEPLGRVGTDT